MKLLRKPETRDWVNIIICTLLIGSAIGLGVEYTRIYGTLDGGDIIATAENVKTLILSYGAAGLPIIILLHALHVVVSFIPAALIQFAGGMIYGVPVGLITGTIGTAVGTAISFYIARIFGKSIVSLFVSEKTMQQLGGRLSGDTSTIALLILFLLPFFPKDLISYFLGLTDAKPGRLFITSALGRLPGMFISTYFGTHILDRNYTMLVIVTSLIGLLICSGYFIFIKQKNKKEAHSHPKP